MKKIELSQGKYALVDDEDYQELNQYNWCFANRYAVRNVTFSGKQTLQYMHRFITNCADGFDVDHANHDKLDNQKANLRICSRSENQQNRKILTVAKSSSYKGVHFNKKSNKWQAQIGLGDKRKHLGYFANEADAAIAYNNAAVEFFGEFALLNVIK